VHQKPSLGRIVLVTTPHVINDQYEHAAIVTQVWDDETINVTVMPGIGTPFTVGTVSYNEAPNELTARSYSWRYPPRV
jgi:surface antigen